MDEERNLLHRNHSRTREDIRNVPAFSCCEKYFDSYIDTNWKNMVKCLTEAEIERRYKRSDFFAHTNSNQDTERNSVKRYVKEILPREYGEEVLSSYNLVAKNELSEPADRVSYTFDLFFNSSEERGEKFSERVKLDVLYSGRKWLIDSEERVGVNQGIMGFINRYIVSFFVRNEVCCVV